ncbi:MAG: hypothetical protein ACKO0Z_16330 [Betaproteobacteria bacterium]
MANPWFRMYSEFATDPKVQMLSETDQRRYIMLLCIRCNGDVTLQDIEVAFQLRISNEEWAETKATLISKNLIDNTSNPVSWDKRQMRSDSSAERVARHRAKTCNGDVTLQKRQANALDTDTDTDKEVNHLVGSKLPTCPQSEILGLFSEKLPELPQPRIWNGVREKNLSSRWRWVIDDLAKKGKPSDKQAGIDFFGRMFSYIRSSDFLMGRGPGSWGACSLGWIVKPENFAKIIEGQYENKSEKNGG